MGAFDHIRTGDVENWQIVPRRHLIIGSLLPNVIRWLDRHCGPYQLKWFRRFEFEGALVQRIKDDPSLDPGSVHVPCICFAHVADAILFKMGIPDD